MKRLPQDWLPSAGHQAAPKVPSADAFVAWLRTPSTRTGVNDRGGARAAILLGAERVVVIDRYDYRLRMAVFQPEADGRL